MKRTLWLLAFLCTTLSGYAYHFENGGLYYTYGYGDDEVWLDRNPNDPYVGKVTVPATIQHEGKTYRVVSILSAVFYGCEHLTQLTLSEGLETINEQAFWGCTALKSIVIPNGVTHLGSQAFRSCTALESVVLPGSLADRLGSYMFQDCISLHTVQLGEGITQLGYCTFSGCSALEHIQLPSTLTLISDRAFEDCTSLPALELPAGLTFLGLQPNCKSLTQLTLPAGLEYFGGFPGSALREIALPKGITEIPSNCFNTCQQLESVTAASPIVKVGMAAFATCDKLTVLPPLTDVEEVGYAAFDLCQSLQSLIFSDKLQTISAGDNIFSGFAVGCISLREVNLGNNVKTLPRSCFHGCSALTSFKVPARCTVIEPSAFESCTSLESITMPERMESIGALQEGLAHGRVFNGCKALKSLRIPEGITVMEYANLSGCYSLNQLILPSTLIRIERAGIKECSLTHLELPTSLREIGGGGIGCDQLEELTIPAGVVTLGSHPEGYAYWLLSENLKKLTFADGEQPLNETLYMHCPNLEELYIGRNIQSKMDKETPEIGYQWSKLKSLSIGSQVEDIRYIYTWSCRELTSLTSAAMRPPLTKAFHNDVYLNVSPKVDTKALAAYQEAPEWKNFTRYVTQEGLTAIEDVLAEKGIDFSKPVAVYRLNGTQAGDSLNGLPAGIYVVRQGKKSTRIAIK